VLHGVKGQREDAPAKQCQYGRTGQEDAPKQPKLYQKSFRYRGFWK
jgi:hypothetical protein